MSSVSCVNHPIWAWEASPQDAPIAYAGLLMIIGNLHRSQQRFKDALEVFEKAQNAFESSGATATTDYLQLLSQLAGFHYEQVGFMKGDDLFHDDILEMLGTCPRCLHNVDSYCMDSLVFQQILPLMTGESQLCAEEIFQCASRIWGLDVPNFWPVAETVSKSVQLFVTFP